jgi:hypothetical protein
MFGFLVAVLSASAKPADGQFAWFDCIRAEAIRSRWAIASRLEFLLPLPAKRANAAIPNPARERFAGAGCATQ